MNTITIIAIGCTVAVFLYGCVIFLGSYLLAKRLNASIVNNIPTVYTDQMKEMFLAWVQEQTLVTDGAVHYLKDRVSPPIAAYPEVGKILVSAGWDDYLTQDELNACLQHEFRHLEMDHSAKEISVFKRAKIEIEADQGAVDAGLGKAMLSAIPKIIDMDFDISTANATEDKKRQIFAHIVFPTQVWNIYPRIAVLKVKTILE